MRWAPCTVTSTGAITTHYITYRVNTAGVPSRVRLVKDALAKVTAASGLHFRYLGTTTLHPAQRRDPLPTGDRVVFDAAQERARTGAELVVAWAKGSATNLLTPERGRRRHRELVRQLQGAAAHRAGRRRDAPRRVTAAWFTAGASVGALLLHELGHAVGLNHVTLKSQTMYPTIGSWSRGWYHYGDLAGLRAVGRPGRVLPHRRVGAGQPGRDGACRRRHRHRLTSPLTRLRLLEAPGHRGAAVRQVHQHAVRAAYVERQRRAHAVARVELGVVQLPRALRSTARCRRTP